jgi:signal transduction histidine kinase
MHVEEGHPQESARRSQRPDRAHLSLVPPSGPDLAALPVQPKDLSVKILRPVLSYVQAKFSDEGMAKVAVASGVELDELVKPATWLTYEQFGAVLAAARELMASDEEFLEAAAFEMKKAFGPLLWVLRTTSPIRTYEIMERTMHFVARESRWHIVSKTATTARLRYTSAHREGRLTCLSRQAWLRALPALWGLPRAQLVKESCIARGDEVCEYQLRWFAVSSLVPPLFGLLVGLLLAWVAMMVQSLRGLEMITFPLLGAVLGFLLESRRIAKVNLAYGDESHNALEALGEEYSNANSELVEVLQRQQQWSHVLEERIAERQQSLEAMVDRVNKLRETRDTALRSLSHDMKSPLAVVKANNGALRSYVGGDAEALDAIQDNEYAIEKAEAILKELLTFSTSETGLFDMRPERILVAPLLDRIRGTLQAFVMKRDIRVSVFQSRHCPEEFETDSFLLNRIIDNILTNATKYTERGSILVEAEGTPGGLCFKVSDTGRGIAGERLDRVFTAQQADANPVIGDSHGLGLPIVVRLLDQLGGQLEVISKPGLGTTFWIRFPLKPPHGASAGLKDNAPQEPLEKVLERVVTIRRTANENT